MLKKIPLNDAVGIELTHDITEIRPGEFKGPAFKKGHRVCDEDLCHLQKLGKNHLYLIDLEKDELHEDQAAVILARGLAGEGVVFEETPSEGRINLYAAYDGLFRVNTAGLAAFNIIEEVICASRHNNTLVKKGDLIAATRAIPLVMKKPPILRAAQIADQNGGIITVSPIQSLRAGLIITGNEVYHGLIKDRFAPILSEKIEGYGSRVHAVSFAPDDADQIKATILSQIENGCELILLSGGMSVDPDDVTRTGIGKAGADTIHYGAAVLPGAMFLVAYYGSVPLLGIPACALHHKTTVLDLIIPRILAGVRIEKKDLALLGHGGLCLNCPDCTFPKCAFGKGV